VTSARENNEALSIHSQGMAYDRNNRV
jgi:hypothetical protein